MANCSDNTYNIKHTDINKGIVVVPKSALITDLYDIALVGKTRLEYGEIFNENVLHLLENFACPEDSGNVGNPDTAVAYGLLLQNPTEGQIWYNSTEERPYVYDGVNWIAIGKYDDVAGNYGVIADGEQLPQPVSQTGYVYPYSECTWIVSPFNYSGETNFMECFTDSSANVTMKYRKVGEGALTSGFANYQIIGIKENTSGGTLPTPPTEP